MYAILQDSRLPRAAVLEKAFKHVYVFDLRLPALAFRLSDHSCAGVLFAFQDAEPPCLALLRAARTALIVELHTRNAGTRPASLDELPADLQSAVPLDPFDGSRIRYRQLSWGYVTHGSRGDIAGVSQSRGMCFVVCRQ